MSDQVDETFHQALETLINQYSQEQYSNTPDFILAEYLGGCLDAFNKAVSDRESWYGRGKELVQGDVPSRE